MTYFRKGIRIPVQEADYHDIKEKIKNKQTIQVYYASKGKLGTIESIRENQYTHETILTVQLSNSKIKDIYPQYLDFYEHIIPPRLDHPMVYALFLDKPIRPRMSKIITYPNGSTLYLSGLEAYTKGQKEMLKNNIQTVISVIDLQPPDLRQYNIQQHWFPIRDSVFSEISVLFPETFSILSQAIQRGENVLVHCAQGISRSVTIIVAFLLNCLTKKPEWIVPFIPEVSGENKTARILEFIRDKRPIINPNKYFVRLLKRLEHDSI